jgi:hypothetical protein
MFLPFTAAFYARARAYFFTSALVASTQSFAFPFPHPHARGENTLPASLARAHTTRRRCTWAGQPLASSKAKVKATVKFDASRPFATVGQQLKPSGG